MNEHFLHFVWKNGLFDRGGLKTAGGELLDIRDPGSYNRNSGPDFLNARIVIGETEWAGNVEIHFSSSAWYGHNHHKDHAYDNVILHVVVENDGEAVTASGTSIDTLVIRIDNSVADRYYRYMTGNTMIACSRDIKFLDRFTIRHFIHLVAVTRLERKREGVIAVLDQCNSNWEEALYRLIAANFGMNVNSEPFMVLASATPLRIIKKHADSTLQVESLLFGQAGMLEAGTVSDKTGDDYFDLLRQEYSILRSKYNLTPANPWVWKFHRIRPANFPTIRISQLAALLVKSGGLFSEIKEATMVSDLFRILSSESSDYWHTHYRFGAGGKTISPATGKIFLTSVIINTVIPLLFHYGKHRGQEDYCDRAIDFADSLVAEKNRITRAWASAGVEPASSFESQGLIELTERYCKNRECLNCHIGSKLISLGKELRPEDNLTLGEPV